jgi:lipid-binding SYLF domain-containing protein
MNTRRLGRWTHGVGLAILALGLVTGPAWCKTKEEKQDEVQKIARETLAMLYKTVPKARAAVEGAAGYAVFSNFGMKLGIVGGGRGKGLAVDNATKKISYMKMAEVQAGLGLGVKQFRLVWVFEKPEDLDKFINSGWELGGQSTAAAQSGGKGESFAGALSISPGVWLYQIVGDGLAVELTAKGTKYYRDSDLN